MSSWCAEESIRVLVRVRPNGNEKSVVTVKDNSIVTPDKQYSYDYVASEDTTQEEMFETCKELFYSFVNGYNATIFAYGQTNSGKTYTMTGIPDEDGNTEFPGLIPRGLQYIFNHILENKLSNNVEYLVKCSFVEIYNEQIYDLLDRSQDRLNVRVNIKQEIRIEPLNEIIIESPRHAEKILKIGLSNRHVASTAMNRESSRSHAVFSIILESREKNEQVDDIKRSCLHLVDLAGSERQKDTKTDGLRLKEAVNINQSLLSLGNVMRNLVEVSQGKHRHISYRESKLTLILKDAIGGNSKTFIVACIHPNSRYLSDTLKTLHFANNAKRIKNKARINVDVHGDMESLTKEVNRLREQLKTRFILPIIKAKDYDTESIWKSKFISAMILRACTVFEEALLIEENGKLKEKLKNLEYNRDLTTHKNIHKITELGRHCSTKKEMEELGKLIKDLLDEMHSEFRENWYKEKIEVSKDQIRHLEMEVKKMRQICTISEQTLYMNIYEDYNKLIKDDDIQMQIQKFHSFKPNIVKMQNDLNKCNLNIDELKLKENTLKFNHIEEKTKLQSELSDLKNKYKAGEEYASQVSNVNRRLTIMVNDSKKSSQFGFDKISRRPRRTQYQIEMEEDLVNSNDLPFIVNREKIEKTIKLEQEISNLKKQNDNLLKEVQKFQEFEKKYEETKLLLETKDIRLQENEVTIKQLLHEKDGINISKQKTITLLNEKISELQNVIDDLYSEQSCTKEQFEVIKEENDCLLRMNETNEAYIEQLKQENSILKNSENQTKENNSELMEIIQELEKVKENEANLILEKEKIQTNANYLQQKFQESLDDMAKLKENNKSLLSHMEILEKDIEFETASREKIEKENVNLNDQLQVALSRESKFTVDIKDYEKRIEELRECNKLVTENLEYENNLLHYQIDDLKREIENQKKHHDNSLNTSYLKTSKVEIDENKENSDNLLSNLIMQVDSLEKELFQVQEYKNTCQNWIEDVVSKFNMTFENYLEKNLENIIHKLDKYREENDNLTSEIFGYKDQIEKSTHLNNVMRNQINVANNQKENLRQNSELLDSLDHCNSKQKIRAMDKLKISISHLHAQNGQLRTLLNSVYTWFFRNGLIERVEQDGIPISAGKANFTAIPPSSF